MSLVEVVTAALTGVAAVLVQPSSPQVHSRPGVPSDRAKPSGATARRLSLAFAAGAAGLLVVPGPAGAVVALVLTVAAWYRLGRLVPRAERRRQRRLESELPVAVDLLAGAVRSGADPAGALRVVAEALPGPVAEELESVGRRLLLGTDPALVWRDLAAHDQLGPLGRSLLRAHRSGASVVDSADRLAAELREASRAEVEARARSVSTRAAAPLGLCFLPAFVLLGIVPLVAGLLGTQR